MRHSATARRRKSGLLRIPRSDACWRAESRTGCGSRMGTRRTGLARNGSRAELAGGVASRRVAVLSGRTLSATAARAHSPQQAQSPRYSDVVPSALRMTRCDAPIGCAAAVACCIGRPFLYRCGTHACRFACASAQRSTAQHMGVRVCARVRMRAGAYTQAHKHRAAPACTLRSVRDGSDQ